MIVQHENPDSTMLIQAAFFLTDYRFGTVASVRNWTVISARSAEPPVQLWSLESGPFRTVRGLFLSTSRSRPFRLSDRHISAWPTEDEAEFQARLADSCDMSTARSKSLCLSLKCASVRPTALIADAAYGALLAGLRLLRGGIVPSPLVCPRRTTSGPTQM